MRYFDLIRVSVLFGLLTIALAGCIAAPRVFEEDKSGPPPELLVLTDARGVQVMSVSGGPPQLAEAMAAALRELEVPASTALANRASYRVVGQVTSTPSGPDGLRANIDWRLTQHDGTLIGVYRQVDIVPIGPWTAGNDRLMTDIAGVSAGALANAILGQPDPEAPPPHVAGDEDIVIPIVVRPVTGAPGDGNRALTDALTHVLRRAGLTVSDTAGANGLIVIGRVNVTRQERADAVKIVWRVLKSDGSEIAAVEQDNLVPQGSLDGPWAEVAYLVANGAAAGIADVQAQLSGRR